MRTIPAVARPYLIAILLVEAVLVVADTLMPESKLFDLDREYTIPAWFSSLQLAMIGLAAFVAFEAERRDVAIPASSRWLWLPLGMGFLYLSADEVLALHERVLTDELRAFLPADSILQSVLPWQMIFAPGVLATFVVLAVLLYTRLGVNAAVRRLGIAALALWTASFVLEGAAKPIFIPAKLYRLEVALEESAEMLAGTCMLAAFVSYCGLRFRGVVAVRAVSWRPVLATSAGLTAAAAVAIAMLSISNPSYMYRRAGDKFNETGAYDRALTAYERAIAEAPEDPDLWRRLGRAALNGKSYRKAADAYRKALEIEPRSAEIYNDLGVALYYLNDYEDARQAYLNALEVRPSYARARKNLGVLYEKEGDDERAASEYLLALKIDPDMADVHRYLGNLLARGARNDEAVAHWRASLVIDPSQTSAPALRRKIAEAEERASTTPDA